jgi:hypothetical protein
VPRCEVAPAAERQSKFRSQCWYQLKRLCKPASFPAGVIVWSL